MRSVRAMSISPWPKPFDGAHNRAFAQDITVDMLELAQGERGQRGSCPCPEILGGDLLAGDFMQIRIDLG